MLQDATVTIRFTGLLVFCFDKSRKICQVGVHTSTDDHELRLRLVKRGPDPKSVSEETLTLSHAQIRHSPDMWLDVEGSPSPTQETAELFIAGRRDEPPSDPRDFRWLVDLEGKHFYNRPLKLREGVLKPILFITKGVFYTAELSLEQYLAIPFARTGTKRRRARGHRLGEIAEVIGANIHLTHPDQALVLRSGQNGPELFRLRREEGTTYEITVENGDTAQAPSGLDFDYYYRAIELSRGEPLILIEPCGLPSARGIMSVCSPVGFGLSAGLVGNYD